MSFRRSDLQEAFFVPGTRAFRVYGYGTSDRLEEVLAPGYFGAAGGLVRPGDLIYVRARADGRPAGAEPAVRMALVMVQSGARGAVNVRLVQDFGRTDEPAALAPTGPPQAIGARRVQGREFREIREFPEFFRHGREFSDAPPMRHHASLL
jgi:hypothetical protein